MHTKGGWGRGGRSFGRKDFEEIIGHNKKVPISVF